MNHRGKVVAKRKEFGNILLVYIPSLSILFNPMRTNRTICGVFAHSNLGRHNTGYSGLSLGNGFLGLVVPFQWAARSLCSRATTLSHFFEVLYSRSTALTPTCGHPSALHNVSTSTSINLLTCEDLKSYSIEHIHWTSALPRLGHPARWERYL